MNYEFINSRKRELGLTNAQLAEITGVTLSTLDKITAGANQNPKLGTLQAIARALGCTLDDFDDVPPLIEYSKDALALAGTFDRLDTHGQRMLRLVADEELARIGDKPLTRAEELQRIGQEIIRQRTGLPGEESRLA